MKRQSQKLLSFTLTLVLLLGSCIPLWALAENTEAIPSDLSEAASKEDSHVALMEDVTPSALAENIPFCEADVPVETEIGMDTENIPANTSSNMETTPSEVTNKDMPETEVVEQIVSVENLSEDESIPTESMDNSSSDSPETSESYEDTIPTNDSIVENAPTKESIPYEEPSENNIPENESTPPDNSSAENVSEDESFSSSNPTEEPCIQEEEPDLMIDDGYFFEEAGTFVLMSVPTVDIIDGNNCAHTNMDTNYIFEQTSTSKYDRTTHRLTGTLTKESMCTNCDYFESWEYSTPASIFESHSFDDSYVCTVCGYDAGFTSCPHSETYQEFYEDEPEVTEVNSTQHCISYLEYTCEICSICEETLLESEGILRTIWGNHEYFLEDGYCLVCEYSSPCAHKNLESHVRTSSDKDSLLEVYYFANSEDASTHLVYTVEGKETYHVCASCGSIVMNGEESYFMDLTVTTEAHSCNADNICQRCGYAIPSVPEEEPPLCSHTNHTTVNTIENTYYVSLNAEKHTYMRHVYVQAICNDCGVSFIVDEYDKPYDTQKHSLSFNYNLHITSCTKCPYQRSLSADEVRASLNNNVQNMIDYLPTPAVFDYRNIAYMAYLNSPKGAATAGHAAMLFIDANGNGFYFSLNSDDAYVLYTDAYVAAKYLTPEEVEILLSTGKVNKAINSHNKAQNDTGYTRWLIKERIEQFSTARFVKALELVREPGKYMLLHANCDDAALALYATDDEIDELAFKKSGELMPNYTFEELLALGNYTYHKTHTTNGFSDFMKGFELRHKPVPFSS